MSCPSPPRARVRSFSPRLLLALALPLAASAASTSAENAAYLEFGRVVAKTFLVDQLHLDEAQFEAVLTGLRQVHAGRPPAPLDPDAQRVFETLQQRLAALQHAAAVPPPPPPDDDPLSRYLASARADLMLQQSSTGLLYRIIRSGAGPRPRPDDIVVLDLLAKAPDGKTDLPQLSRQDSKIAVSALLPGLAEGIQMLALGGSAVLVVPPRLSFANGPWPAGLEPGMPLLFQINLKDILPARQP